MKRYQELSGSRAEVGGWLSSFLSGDFRQSLPAIPKESKRDVVRACLKSSPLWRQITTCRLNTIIRVQMYGDYLSAKFAEDILPLSECKMPLDTRGEVLLSSVCTTFSTINDLNP